MQDARVESLSGKSLAGMDHRVLDQNLLDKGEQAELTRLLEWFGPLEFWIFEAGARSDNESVMKMWERGDIPGVTGQGAGDEATGVVNQVTEDIFNNFLRKPGCGGEMCTRCFSRGICEYFINPSFGSVPNSHKVQLGSCRTSK